MHIFYIILVFIVSLTVHFLCISISSSKIIYIFTKHYKYFKGLVIILITWCPPIGWCHRALAQSRLWIIFKEAGVISSSAWTGALILALADCLFPLSVSISTLTFLVLAFFFKIVQSSRLLDMYIMKINKTTERKQMNVHRATSNHVYSPQGMTRK